MTEIQEISVIQETVIFMVRFPEGRRGFLFEGTFAKGKNAGLDASSSRKLLNFAKIYLEVPGCTPRHARPGVAPAAAISAPPPRGILGS